MTEEIIHKYYTASREAFNQKNIELTAIYGVDSYRYKNNDDRINERHKNAIEKTRLSVLAECKSNPENPNELIFKTNLDPNNFLEEAFELLTEVELSSYLGNWSSLGS